MSSAGDSEDGAVAAGTACALTIAGSDSGGGAGIQADLKTFTALRVYGASVVTALTAQNTRGVQGIHIPPTSFVAQQLKSVMSDLPIGCVKTGMLPTAEIVRVTADAVKDVKGDCHLVVDPVLVATSGDSLVGEEDVVDAMVDELFPLATLVTPNVAEAERVTGMSIHDEDDRREACRLMVEKYGCRAVLLKGGHLRDGERGMGGKAQASDVLFDGLTFDAFVTQWVDTRNTHGTGCTLASAIAAGLARGLRLKEAIMMAKQFVLRSILGGLDVGEGPGPLYHMHTVKEFSLFSP